MQLGGKCLFSLCGYCLTPSLTNNLFLVINTPEEINQNKDNEINLNQTVSKEDPMPMRDFLKFGKFWFISLAFALQFFQWVGFYFT